MNFLQRARTRLRDAFEIERSIDHKVTTLTQEIAAIIQGMNNQSQLLNNKFETLVEGMNNQSQLLNNKFEALIEGMNNQSALLNRNLKALIEGMNHQSDLLNRKARGIILEARQRVGDAPAVRRSATRSASRSGGGASPARAGPCQGSRHPAFKGGPAADCGEDLQHVTPGLRCECRPEFSWQNPQRPTLLAHVVYADLKKLTTGVTVEDRPGLRC